VRVFPVPVAPATSPCRFIIERGTRTAAPSTTALSRTAIPRSSEAPETAYPFATASLKSADMGGMLEVPPARVNHAPFSVSIAPARHMALAPVDEPRVECAGRAAHEPERAFTRRQPRRFETA